MTSRHDSQSKNYKILDTLTVLYLALVPFDIIPLLGTRTITAPFGAVLVLAWLVDSSRRPERNRFPSIPGYLLFAYAVWATFTLFWSVDGGAATAALLNLLLQVALVVVLSDTMSRVWFPALISMGLSTCLLAVFLISRPADELRADRANIGGIDENVTALVLAVGLAALVFIVTSLKGRWALLTAVPAMVVGAAILHSGSRSGALAAAGIVGVAFLPLLRSARPSAWLRALILLALSYVAFTRARQAGLLPERVLEVLNWSLPKDDSGRSAITDLYLTTFDHWALFGVGIGNDLDYLVQTQSRAMNSHSLFWTTWIETGLVGLVLLGALFATVIRWSFRSAAPRAVLLMSVPLAVFALTLGGNNTSAFWVVIALALTRGRTGQIRDANETATRQAKPPLGNAPRMPSSSFERHDASE